MYFAHGRHMFLSCLSLFTLILQKGAFTLLEFSFSVLDTNSFKQLVYGISMAADLCAAIY